MAAESYPTFDGEAQSWADIKVTLQPYGGAELAAGSISDVSLGVSVERGEQRSAGGALVALTGGQETCEGSITWYADGWDAAQEALAAVAIAKGWVDGNGTARIGKVPFDVVIQHELVDGSIRQVDMKGCRLNGHSSDFTEGTDADKIETPVSVMRIVRRTAKGTAVSML
jgi:hypothetical protein